MKRDQSSLRVAKTAMPPRMKTANFAPTAMPEVWGLYAPWASALVQAIGHTRSMAGGLAGAGKAAPDDLPTASSFDGGLWPSSRRGPALGGRSAGRSGSPGATGVRRSAKAMANQPAHGIGPCFRTNNSDSRSTGQSSTRVAQQITETKAARHALGPIHGDSRPPERAYWASPSRREPQCAQPSPPSPSPRSGRFSLAAGTTTRRRPATSGSPPRAGPATRRPTRRLRPATGGCSDDPRPARLPFYGGSWRR